MTWVWATKTLGGKEMVNTAYICRLRKHAEWTLAVFVSGETISYQEPMEHFYGEREKDPLAKDQSLGEQ